jgi:predicted nucleotidyltransferase component of viral defense system
MPASDAYRAQVSLLVRVLPLVAEEAVFALKGGTAINLFVRDLPRLSVDIDLTYLPVEDRATSLGNIDTAIRRIAARIGESVPRSRTQVVPLHNEGAATKVLVASDGVQIKIEVTPVIRGCVYSPETRAVCDRVEELFGYAEVPVVSFPDLYAGKIVAALDRQHPRDLFDVRDLLANEGISDELRRAFIVYILSHNRPMGEVLAPTRKDLRQEFDAGFAGMTEEPVTLEALYDAREALIAEVVGKMPLEHRRFLLSFKAGEPDWDLLGVPGAAELPAVRWKVDNLAKLSEGRREKLLSDLGRALAT